MRPQLCSKKICLFSHFELQFNFSFGLLLDISMWPGRLPYIQQPQTNLYPFPIPMQVPQPTAYIQQPLLGAPTFLPTTAIPQPKVVISQPLQYQQVLNPTFYQQPPTWQLLQYPRFERSPVYSNQQIALKTRPVQSTETVNLLAHFQNAASTIAVNNEHVSVSSQSSAVASPCQQKPDYPVTIANPLLLADFSNESSRFYEAFYGLCRKLAQSGDADDLAKAKLLEQSLAEITNAQKSEECTSHSELESLITRASSGPNDDQQPLSSFVFQRKDAPVCQLPL